MAQPAHAWWSDDRSDAPDPDAPDGNALATDVDVDAAEVPGQVTLWDDAEPREVEVAESADVRGAPVETPVRAQAVRKAYAANSADAATPGHMAPGAAGRPLPRKRVSLTGRGAVLCVFIVTLLAGLADMAISGHRGGIFSVGFVVVATGSASLVRRRDLAASVIAPPLVYCVVVGLISIAGSGGSTGGLLTREGVTFATSFITGTPWLWLGSAGAAAVAWWRARKTATPTA